MKLGRFLPALVVASALVVSEARADFTVPATVGIPGDYLKVNDDAADPYWFWGSEVSIYRGRKGAPEALEWIIPLVFYGVAGHRQKWGARVMVSHGVSCNIRWWPYDDLESGPIGTGSAPALSDDGSLLLTTPDLCAPVSPTRECITTYNTAQVSCWVPPGGWVGQVNYWLWDLDARDY
jgi:hypothetical protein